MLLVKTAGNAERSSHVYETSLAHVISMIHLNLATSVIPEFMFYRPASVFSAVENLHERCTCKAGSHLLTHHGNSRYLTGVSGMALSMCRNKGRLMFAH